MGPLEALGEVGRAAAALLAVLVPPLCVVCERRLEAGRRWLCTGCEKRICSLARIRLRRIDVDGRTIEVRCLHRYRPAVARVITEMKYADKPGLGLMLGQWIGNLLGTVLSRDGVLVPVPMHPAKRRERGYNQSEMIARGIAAGSGFVMASNVLTKRRRTPSQTALARDSRLENLEGAFAQGTGEPPVGKSVVLVDDVVTTGSTLRECAGAISRLGIEEISACVVASSV